MIGAIRVNVRNQCRPLLGIDPRCCDHSVINRPIKDREVHHARVISLLSIQGLLQRSPVCLLPQEPLQTAISVVEFPIYVLGMTGARASCDLLIFVFTKATCTESASGHQLLELHMRQCKSLSG